MNDRSFINQLGYIGRIWAGSHGFTRLLPKTPRPIMASLKLTENCQAACVTCDYWRTTWQDKITTDGAIDLINQLSECGVKYLRFTGGEPLLRRDLFKILEGARTSSFRRISIQTNGLLLKKLYQEINASPLTRVSVSIDGLEQNNDRIRGVPGYFRLALEGFSLIKGKELQLCVTLSRDPIRQLDSLMELAREHAADFAFNVLDNHMYFTRSIELRDLWPEEEDVKSLSRALQYQLHRPSYEIAYIEQYFRRATTLKEPPCVLGFLDVIITSKGDVLTGCPGLPPVGNILDQRLEQIFASAAYRQRCAAMIRRECPGCLRGFLMNLKFKHARPTAGTISSLVARLGGAKKRTPMRMAEEAVQ